MPNPVESDMNVVPVYVEAAYTPTDPRFVNGQQWYINNPLVPTADLSLTAVWDDYRGAGINIGVIDDGVEYSHPDLAANSDPSQGRNFASSFPGDPDDGQAYLSGDNHGTLVAGVIAADDNGIEVVGVAPDATIAGLRIGFGAGGDDSQIRAAFTAAKNFDVVNNSWGYGGYFYDNLNDAGSFGSATNPFIAIGEALTEAVDVGRGGLGTVFVIAAGNDGNNGQDVNYHGFQSSPHTITVGGFNKFGKDYSASTPGAAVLVSGPAVSVRTTDREGSLGSNSGDTAAVSGTSFASPAVAGVVALMLEANPNLGYRDVQEILTLSSEMVDPADLSWDFNGSSNWNGGGRHISNKLGFGSVDGYNAVRLAETWELQSTYGNARVVSASANIANGTLIQNTVVAEMTIGDIGIDLDQVVLSVDMDHSFIGDLVITLESPNGTISTMMNRPGFGAGKQSTFIDEFEFSSVQFWDEAVAGTWTLSVQDAGTIGAGNVTAWGLTFIGDTDTGDDTYVYTSEWASLGGEAARRILSDEAGEDTLNFATIAEDVTVSLAAGGSNSLLGHTYFIDSATVIENAVTGDGDDNVTGNGSGNILRGMRGDDRLQGQGGDDLIDGGAGTDTAVYGGLFLDYQFTAEADGSLTVVDSRGIDGTDSLLSIEFLEFASSLVAAANLFADPGPEPDPDLDIGTDTGSLPPLTVEGGSVGGEQVMGTDGEDVIGSGSGAWNKLFGLAGDDVFVVTNAKVLVKEAFGNGNDTVYSSAANLTVASEVENFILIEGGGNLFANRYDNRITGNNSENLLKGNAGNDTIFGKGGNDTLDGGKNDDIIDGGDGIDTASFSGMLSGYQITENADGSLRVEDLVGADGTDTLRWVEFLAFSDQTIAAPDSILNTGSAPDPTPDPNPTPAPDPGLVVPPDVTISGTAAGGETVSGTSGDDVLATGGGSWDKLRGGAGNDSYIVDSPQILVGEAYGGGEDTVYTSAQSFNITSYVEIIYLLDGAQNVNGKHGSNTIHGNAADNRLSGASGDDELNGNGGNDILDGGVGEDRINGGSGSDIAVFSGAAASYSVTLLSDGTSLQVSDAVGNDGTDILTGIEILRFSDGDVLAPASAGAVADAASEPPFPFGSSESDAIF